jgi:hypothetical protein
MSRLRSSSGSSKRGRRSQPLQSAEAGTSLEEEYQIKAYIDVAGGTSRSRVRRVGHEDHSQAFEKAGN